ncbi:MAG: hypothetical protein AB1728_15525 [Bacteroidota bacterium]
MKNSICLKLLVLLQIVSLIGCTSRQIMYPEYLQADSSNHIRITTKEGKIIKMSPQNYHVVRISDSLYVEGKGTSTFGNKEFQEKKFEGMIGFGEIKQVEIIETKIPGIVLYPAVFILSVSVVTIIYLAIALDGRGFGG